MSHKSDARSRLSAIFLVALPASLLGACGDDVTNHHYNNNYYGEGGEEGDPPPNPGTAGKGGKDGGGGGTSGNGGMSGAEDGGTPSEPQAGGGGEDSGVIIDPRYPDAPVENTPKAEQDLDVFRLGNHWWFAVSDEQRERMNAARWGGGGGPGPINGDIYQPGGGGGDATFVDHLWVSTAAEEPQISDYGKVQVKVVGQSTGRDWNEQNIPNLNIDSNQFVKQQRIGGFEHLRFGNCQVGSIFRERLTLQLFNLLGYPAPHATFAWVHSNVWGWDADDGIPYTLVERYKRDFCESNADLLGGGCVNMWEYVGDFSAWEGGSLFDQAESCQVDRCDATRVKQLEATLRDLQPPGEGFKEAMSEWIAWPEFHQFQCLEWMLGVGDDTIHNGGNNSVLVERSDGKFQFLPYSVDISLGQDWYSFVRLAGDGNAVARGCQADPQCWADTIATCENLLQEFSDHEPNKLLAAVYDELDAEGMLRPGDEERYQFIDNWFTSRLERMPIELEKYAEDPNAVLCGAPYVDCGGWCGYEWECPQQCVPPDDPPPPPPMGQAGGIIIDPGMGVGGGFAAGGAGPIGGSFGMAGGFGEGGDGGLEPCPPKEEYKIAR